MPKPMTRLAIVLVVLLSACTPPGSLGLGAQCANNSECQPGNGCSNGRCSVIGLPGLTGASGVIAGPGEVSTTVTLTPMTANVLVRGTLQLSGAASGASNAVTYSVVSGGGSINASGLFTAPDTAGTTVVRATSVANSSAAATATLTIDLLTAPTNVQISSTASVVSLSWTAQAGVTLFRVLRSDSPSGPFTQLIEQTGTTYNDGAVTIPTIYYYLVEPVYSGLTGPRSAQAQIRASSGRELYVGRTLGLPNANVVIVFDLLQSGNSAPLRSLTHAGTYTRRLAIDRSANELYILTADSVLIVNRNGNGGTLRSLTGQSLANDIAVDPLHRRLFVLYGSGPNNGTVRAFDADTLVAVPAHDKAVAATCAVFTGATATAFNALCDAHLALGFDTLLSELAVLRIEGARHTTNIYDYGGTTPKASAATEEAATGDSFDFSIAPASQLGSFIAVSGYESMDPGVGHHSTVFAFHHGGNTNEGTGTPIPKPVPANDGPSYRAKDIDVAPERNELVVPMSYFESGTPDVEYGEILFLTPSVGSARAKLSGPDTQITSTVSSVVVY